MRTDLALAWWQFPIALLGRLETSQGMVEKAGSIRGKYDYFSSVFYLTAPCPFFLRALRPSITVSIVLIMKSNPLTCPTCSKEFSDAAKYTHHVSSRNCRKSVQCPYCPRAFDTRRFRDHLIAHDGMSPYMCPIPECKRMYKSVLAVKLHLKNIHSKKSVTKKDCPRTKRDADEEHDHDLISNSLVWEENA